MKCDSESRPYNEIVEIAMDAYANDKFVMERIVTIKE